ncbi:NTP/NDP exchange transporter [Desulfosarcina sp.]|uniref:NTP/NDP exchange transporter n=1 Tax=Desulfosarcina sp. TaxID=2027861 RepID=UPI00397084FA
MNDTPSSAAASDRKHAHRVRFDPKRLITLKPGELPAFFWSFTYFFALLCSYYIIRPMRDEMGIAGGVEHLQWMFSGTFLVMLAAVPLFGWVTRRFPVRRFLLYVYLFFIANLLLFFILFKSNVTGTYVARAFFIWASVFNLFIVSIFWSLMADIFDNDQAKRLFGMIAGGGTAGALTGPILTATLVLKFGPTNLLLISAAFLGWAVLCLQRLMAWRDAAGRPAPGEPQPQADAAMGGGILAGVQLILRSPYLIGICLMMLLFTTLATFLYFQQAHIIHAGFDNPAERTALFAAMDFAVNALTIILQIFLTSRIVKRLGLAWTLAVVPLMVALGFLVLSLAPVLAVLITLQVLRRAGNYALMRPAREMLYVVLGKEEKYKAKNFIDTVVYRGGDAISAWIFAGLQHVGLTAAGIALAAVPFAGMWALIAYRLGTRQEQMAKPGKQSNPVSDSDRR